SKQCLDRRIADLKTLKHEVSAWENERNSIGATVRWQFKKDNARDKLQRHYQKLQN
ncbi:MAG TPA: IS630 family transposase, partial [Methanothrix sp.]|nr:IS630 family transposase [Methanothrix sp.]